MRISISNSISILHGVRKSNAVTDAKKKEMDTKVKALNMMSGAIASAGAAGAAAADKKEL